LCRYYLSIARFAVGSSAVVGAGGTDNGKIMSLSAKTRIIQSVGAPVVTGERIPPVVEDKNEVTKSNFVRIGGLVC